MFPIICKACAEKIIPINIENKKSLQNRIEEYLTSVRIENFDWIQNLFINITVTNLNFELCEVELVDVSSDHGLKLKHVQLPLDAFSLSAMEEYVVVHEKAIKVLLQFTISYLS